MPDLNYCAAGDAVAGTAEAAGADADADAGTEVGADAGADADAGTEVGADAGADADAAGAADTAAFAALISFCIF